MNRGIRCLVGWLLIFSPLLLALVHYIAITEERKMENQFGENYRAYQKQIHRYF